MTTLCQKPTQNLAQQCINALVRPKTALENSALDNHVDGRLFKRLANQRLRILDAQQALRANPASLHQTGRLGAAGWRGHHLMNAAGAGKGPGNRSCSELMT